MITLILTCALSLAHASSDADTERLARALLRKLTFPSSERTGTPYQVAHCRLAPEGCAERVRLFSEYFVAAGAAHRVDPWILAGMALRESGLHPWATGAGGELGILQIHPRTIIGRTLRWFTDPQYRERCRGQPGACQGPVVDAAASMLRNAIERCGSLEAGLSGYNTGRCSNGSRYARRVLRTRDELRSLAETEQAT